eukprot:m.358345 g.358345  ORF g.358345 m.358345 type:complete len:610 (+) comp16619_c0_seq25:251-2080(+)
MFCPAFPFRQKRKGKTDDRNETPGGDADWHQYVEVDLEKLFSQYGVRSAKSPIPDNTAGVALLLEGLGSDLTLDDGPEIIDGLIKGCESLGGSVGTVLGHVKLKDVIEIVPSAHRSSEETSPGTWVHLTLGGYISHDRDPTPIPPCVDSALSWAVEFVSSLQRLALQEPPVFQPLDARLLHAQVLATAQPVSTLSWVDVECQDDPALRVEVPQHVTDVCEVWWTNPKNVDHGAVRVVAKWVNHGVALHGADGAVLNSRSKRYIEEEAAVLHTFKNDNVINVIGLLSADPVRPSALVMEHMSNGSLRHFLRTRRGKSATLKLRASFLVDVASGLAFIHAHAMWHGDVAARNVLLSDTLQCKITNIGHIVGASRWSPPEIFEGGLSSPGSDMWSLGILALEVMSNGRLPFPEETSLDNVGKLVMNGAKPEAPRECPFDLARRLMYQCWAFEVSERISALEFKANAIVVGGVEWGAPFPMPIADAAQCLHHIRRTRFLLSDPDDNDGSTKTPVRCNAIAPLVRVTPELSPRENSEVEGVPAEVVCGSGEKELVMRPDEYRLVDLELSYRATKLEKIKRAVSVPPSPSGSYRSQRRLAVQRRLISPEPGESLP